MLYWRKEIELKGEFNKDKLRSNFSEKNFNIVHESADEIILKFTRDQSATFQILPIFYLKKEDKKIKACIGFKKTPLQFVALVLILNLIFSFFIKKIGFPIPQIYFILCIIGFVFILWIQASYSYSELMKIIEERKSKWNKNSL